jgi:hypothetical protein
MTFPKKGSRKITVNGRVYLWRLKAYHPEWNNAAFITDIPERCEVLIQAPNGSIQTKEFHGVAVTPAMVAEAICEGA